MRNRNKFAAMLLAGTSALAATSMLAAAQSASDGSSTSNVGTVTVQGAGKRSARASSSLRTDPRTVRR